MKIRDGKAPPGRKGWKGVRRDVDKAAGEWKVIEFELEQADEAERLRKVATMWVGDYDVQRWTSKGKIDIWIRQRKEATE